MSRAGVCTIVPHIPRLHCATAPWEIECWLRLFTSYARTMQESIMPNPLRSWGPPYIHFTTSVTGRRSTILTLLLLIVAAFILRVPGIPWGIVHGDFFEPDEFQHTH